MAVDKKLIKKAIKDRAKEEGITEAEYIVNYLNDKYDLQLKRVGGTFMGFAPRGERTPSFSIKQGTYAVMIKDFGEANDYNSKKIGGNLDIFNVVGCAEKGTYYPTQKDFDDICTIINNDLNLGLENVKPKDTNYVMSKEQKESRNIIKTMTKALEFFKSQMTLDTEFAEQARGAAYMELERGYTLDECKKYEIGYMPNPKLKGCQDSTKDFIEFMDKEGFSKDDLVKANLLVQKEYDNGNTLEYCPFQDRVIFPFKDIKGNVLGFSGRQVDTVIEKREDGTYSSRKPERFDDDYRYLVVKKPTKYRNTVQIPNVFEKKNLLFNENRISELNSGNPKLKTGLIITEGYLDALAMQKSMEAINGNTVYTPVALGTSNITSEQLDKIEKFPVSDIILCLDNDDAGKKGTISAIHEITKRGLDCIILKVPEGYKDFDSYYKSISDEDNLKKVIREAFKENSMFAEKFVLDDVKKKEYFYKNGARDVVKAIGNFIKDFEPAERLGYLQEMAKDESLKLTPFDTIGLAQSMGIDPDYMPYIINPEYTPTQTDLAQDIQNTLEAAQKEYDDIDNIKKTRRYEICSNEIKVDIAKGQIIDINLDSLKEPLSIDGLYCAIYEDNIAYNTGIDVSPLDTKFFSYEIENNKLKAVSRDNFKNNIEFTSKKPVNNVFDIVNQDYKKTSEIFTKMSKTNDIESVTINSAKEFSEAEKNTVKNFFLKDNPDINITVNGKIIGGKDFDDMDKSDKDETDIAD